MPLFINEAYAEVYADDSTVHAANKDTIVVEYKLQNDAVGFWTWCRNKKMFIHFTKTSVMTTGSRYHTSRTDPISIIIDNEQIQNVESQKLLGVIIDRTLSWDKQIDSVCLNITRRITLLKLLSKYVDQLSLKQNYNSYILPIFYYGCMICTSHNMNRLSKLQKRAARIILQADIMTPSQQMLQELGWLPFPKRVKYHTCHTCVMVFKALNGQAPEYLSDLLIKSEQIKNLRSNDKEILKVPLSKTAAYDRSFSVNGAKLWNSLPFYLRQSTNINTFKSLLNYICRTVKHKSTFSAGFWLEKKKKKKPWKHY